MVAGEGTRMRPLSQHWPKPVLPVDGKPVVVTLVHELGAFCDRIVVVTGHLAAQVEVLVVFGAEHGEEGLARKRTMLETKNADLVVFNDVGRRDIGFDARENEVVVITRAGEQVVEKASKEKIAAAILDEVERLLP